jgi:adenylate kinase
MYHVVFDPPATDGQCARCHGALYQRDDDREETIVARLDVYDAHTAPLLAHYEAQGLLRDIDGGGSPDAVFARVLRGIEGAA